MNEETLSLMESFIIEAQNHFDCQFDNYPETEMRMFGSDHGYSEYVITGLSVSIGNEEAVLIVQDAGETQRRFVLLVLDDDPFIKVHNYYTP